MRFDVLIVGGGLAGLSLAVALRSARLSVALVESRPPRRPEGWDARVYAVSPACAGFLSGIGIWDRLDSRRIEPVQTMAVRGDAGGRLDFSAYDSGVSELAWILEGSLMQTELWETVTRQANLTLFCPARPQKLELGPQAAVLDLEDGRRIEAALVVGADGADSWVRNAAGIAVNFKHYGQMGVVANFECSRPHRGTAFQWFREDGILAWLPLPGNRMSMVWSTPDEHARELLGLSAEALCQRVAAAGGDALGDFSLLTPAAGFALRLMRAPHTAAHRLALIGDAAHAIHPLSGHGINLGFLDARALAALLAEKPDFVDAGDLALLRRYQRARREEVVALQTVTDGLQRLFAPAHPLLAAVRNAGMNLTGRLPILRDALVRYALG
ncbi:MAG: UbiH/UbiF family hydroxylase [Rhodocyclaceae bacterium]|nr:UbiH/UbiF family hydroxylase [Rhodocyclaceae bacterium]